MYTRTSIDLFRTTASLFIWFCQFFHGQRPSSAVRQFRRIRW